MLGPESSVVNCPKCQASVETGIKRKAGLVPIISGVVLCLLGCIFGCCLIPCCLKECMDVEHSCPTCKTYLGRFKRFD